MGVNENMNESVHFGSLTGNKCSKKRGSQCTTGNVLFSIVKEVMLLDTLKPEFNNQVELINLYIVLFLAAGLCLNQMSVHLYTAVSHPFKFRKYSSLENISRFFL